jgi:hypothetical protein
MGGFETNPDQVPETVMCTLADFICQNTKYQVSERAVMRKAQKKKHGGKRRALVALGNPAEATPINDKRRPPGGAIVLWTVKSV